MEKIQSFVRWFITSSQDPEKYSATIKSLVTLFVLFGYDQTVVNEAGNQIANFIVAWGMLLSAVTALWGIGRKVRLGRWAATPRDSYSKS